MNLISTMLGFIGRKIKNLETEVGKINSTLDDVSPAPKVIPIERGGTGATTTNGALDNLFGESPLPISRGGTGVNTQEALASLCVKFVDIDLHAMIDANKNATISIDKENIDYPITPGYNTGWEYFVGVPIAITTNVTNGEAGHYASYVNVYGVYFTNDNKTINCKCRNLYSKLAYVTIKVRVAYIPKPKPSN